MKHYLSVLPAMLVLSTAGGVEAQTLPPPPTHAQGVAADHRVGSTFSASGSTIFYQDTGSGTPLILIHGYPLSGALYQYQQTALSKRFRVITLDLPGFGRSSAPVGFGTTALYARDVLALMDHLGIGRAVIGGHSMGGIITQEIYREAPERFVGMILFDTIAMAASAIETGEFAGYGVQAYTKGVSSIIDSFTPQLLTGTTRTTDGAATTQIEDIIAEGSLSGILAGASTLATRPDYTSQLSRISVPVLVVEGLDDPIYPVPIAQALSTQVPYGTLALIPGASHASMFEQPATVDTAIDDWAATNRL